MKLRQCLIAGLVGLCSLLQVEAVPWMVEELEDSYVAVSPDGKWKLNLEWGWGEDWVYIFWGDNSSGSGKLEFPTELVFTETWYDIDGEVWTDVQTNQVWAGSPWRWGGLERCPATEVVIPKEVVGITEGLFFGMGKLAKVALHVENVPEYIFDDCSSLQLIEYCEGVKTIGLSDMWYSVVDCVKIASTVEEIEGPIGSGSVNRIEVDSANPHFKVIDGVLYGVDNAGRPESLIRVTAACKQTHFVVPETVKTMKVAAFCENAALKKVTIPAGVSYIGEGVFTAPNISEIVVKDGNAHYKIEDGVLYTANGKLLVAYPAARPGSVFVAPDGVETVYDVAFWRVKYLQTVVFPASLREIQTCAFESAAAVSRVVVQGTGPLQIGDYAFGKCDVRELDLRHRDVSVDSCVFENAFLLKTMHLGSFKFNEVQDGLYAECIFDDTALTDVYCWGDFGYDENHRREYSGFAFKRSFTLHVPKGSALPNRIIDRLDWDEREYTITVKKDLDPAKKCDFAASFPALTLNPAGGSVSPKTLKLKWNACGEIVADGALPTPVRSGYAFVGWEVGAKGFDNTPQGAFLADPVKPVLTAKWDRNIPKITLEVEGGAPGCKTTGAGWYNAGARITLKAIPAGGSVFAGWYEDGWPLTDNNDYLKASLAYTVGSAKETVITALFATSAEDAASLELDFPASDHTDSDGSYELEADAMVASISQPKITVKGLPAGISYNAKTGLIAGKATKPGVYKVTVSVTNASVKKAKTAEFELTVPNFQSPLINDVCGLGDAYALAGGALDDDEGFNVALEALAAQGWTVRITGLPAGMRYDRKTGAVTGTATKTGSYTVYVNATKAGETKQLATTTFSVTFPKLSVVRSVYDGNDWDEGVGDEVGTVTGEGEYPAGKKVTLRAVAKKGYVFAGWDGMFEVSPHWNSATIQYETSDEDATMGAIFVTEEVDRNLEFPFADGKVVEYADNLDENGEFEYCFGIGSWSQPKVTVSGLPAGIKVDYSFPKTPRLYGKATKPGEYVITVKATNATIKKQVIGKFTLKVPNLQSGLYDGQLEYAEAYALDQGVAADLELSVADGDKVTVAGLPAGMKWDAKNAVITGAPTKAGTFTVTITTRRGKQTFIDTVTVAVAEPDSLIAATYNGFIGYAVNPDESAWMEIYGIDSRGTLTATVAANGRITAKVVCAKGTYSFSAACWDEVYERDDGIVEYAVAMKTAKGDELELYLRPGMATYPTGSCSMDGVFVIGADGDELVVLADREMLAVRGKYPFDVAEEIVAELKGNVAVFDMLPSEEEENVWIGAFPANPKKPQLTFKVDAAGRVTMSGKIGSIAVNARGDVFRPFSLVVTVGGKKKTLNVLFWPWDFIGEEKDGVQAWLEDWEPRQ